MLAQAITNTGAVSADWILTISFIVIGTLLMGIGYVVGNNFLTTLKNINDKLSEHDDKFDDHLRLHHEIKIELTGMKNSVNHHNSQLAQDIVNKIRAITPPNGNERSY